MTTAGWITLVAAALLTAVPPASAQQGDGRPGDRQRGRSFAERQELRQQRAERLADDPRGDAPRERCDGKCRMTPEERMKLRRDIHEAGRDIYRRGPRHARD